MIYPPGLAYENAVPNIPETSLQIGDFVKVVFGAFKDYYAVATGMSYGDEIEIKYFKRRVRYYVLCENDLDSRPIKDVQKAVGKMMNSREHYFVKTSLLISYEVITLFSIFSLRTSHLPRDVRSRDVREIAFF